MIVKLSLLACIIIIQLHKKITLFTHLATIRFIKLSLQ